MLYNSLQFLIFFPIVFFVHFALPHRFRWMWLLGASYYFYMAWRAEYIILIVGATYVAYVAGLRIARSKSQNEKKRYVYLSLLIMIGVLFVFKYFNFFNDSFRSLFEALNISYAIPALHVILPIGISFYTFQLASYVIDVYRGTMKAESHFGLFSAYLTFFPQLVAGPIERASHLLKQFYEVHTFDYQRATNGFKLMAWGFFKKVVVADRLAPFVQTVYSDPTQYEGVSLMLATFFFAFQVYCDFSGYTDIALGAAQSLGFSLTDNFNTPYFAKSIPEFWKRWHISLSTWLTDYVYTPLTKSRFIKLPWYKKFLLSLLLTFLISGLWHGANWTFVAWGGLHGIYMICSVAFQKQRKKFVRLIGLDKLPRLYGFIQIIITFCLVCITYIFFRANSLADAWYTVTHLFSGLPYFVSNIGSREVLRESLLFAGQTTEWLVAVSGIAIVLLVHLKQTTGSVRESINGWHPAARWAVYCFGALSILVFGDLYSAAQQFIYFQF